MLIQPYERRVLTYVPTAPEGFKVQMGNIGQHYYAWRYKDAGKPPALAGMCGRGYPKFGFGKVYENNIVKFDLGCQQVEETTLTIVHQKFAGGQLLGVFQYDYYSGMLTRTCSHYSTTAPCRPSAASPQRVDFNKARPPARACPRTFNKELHHPSLRQRRYCTTAWAHPPETPTIRSSSTMAREEHRSSSSTVA